MLVTNKKLLDKAKKEGYSVGAFNVYNMESILAVVEAAEEEKSPVIIAVSPKSIKHAGLENISTIVKKIAEKSSVEISLHLDHGKDLKTIVECISAGFTSVMFDGSNLKLDKNIELTKKVVEIAHAKGISVEGEVGVLSGGKDMLTDPKEAALFVEKTGVDALAVAIGTSHGAYKFKGQPFIDFERLKQIREIVDVPLVLHGASLVPQTMINKANKFGAKLHGTSGIPEKHIRKAISLGITKINIDTDLRIAFFASVREFLAKNPKQIDPRIMLSKAKEEMKKTVIKRIKLFGSNGKSGEK